MADSTITAVNTPAVQTAKTEAPVKTPSAEAVKTTTPPPASASTSAPQSNEQGKKLDVVA